MNGTEEHLLCSIILHAFLQSDPYPAEYSFSYICYCSYIINSPLSTTKVYHIRKKATIFFLPSSFLPENPESILLIDQRISLFCINLIKAVLRTGVKNIVIRIRK